jgi:hypothetical protein
VADPRAPYPPSALSPVSPEVARAAAAAFSGRAWIASAVFLLPALALAAFLEAQIREVHSEGRRRVLLTGVFLIQLLAAASAVAVHVRRARDRVENSEPHLGPLFEGWKSTLGMTASLCAGFLVVWVALGGAVETLSDATSRFAGGLLRFVPLSLAALMAADLAALALLVTWLSAIRAVEGCPTVPAASILRGIWRKSRSRLILHAGVSGVTTWAVWFTTSSVVGAVYAGAGGPGPPGFPASILYDDALRTWLVWTPPLAVLGSAGVASYLLLRPLTGNTAP